MSKFIHTFALFAFLCVSAFAQAHAEIQSMIDQIKKTVSFVYVSTPKGDMPNGTAFFVLVPHKTQTDQVYIYLVTAKHVLQKNQSTGELFDSVKLRVNKKDESSELITIPLIGPGAAQIMTHTDQSVDIAVIPIVIHSADIYDIKCLPDSLLVTKETFVKLNIREGDDVFFGGLFTPFPGARKNIPILRFGKVAMISDEKIPNEGQMLDLYLMETQSFGGNSGAPVFFNLSPTRHEGQIVLGPTQLYLAGVMKGNFSQLNELAVINQSSIPVSRENSGIAAVVPSYLLHDILFGATALKARGE